MIVEPITVFYAIGLPILVSFVIMYFVASTLVVAIATLCLVYIVFCAAASVLALCNGIRDPRWHGAWHAFQQAKQLCLGYFQQTKQTVGLYEHGEAVRVPLACRQVQRGVAVLVRLVQVRLRCCRRRRG